MMTTATTVRTPQHIDMYDSTDCEIICALQMLYMDGQLDRVSLDDWDWSLCVPEALFRRGYSKLDIRERRLTDLIESYDAWLETMSVSRADWVVEDTDELRELYENQVRPFMEERLELFRQFSTQYSLEHRPPIASDFYQLQQQGYRVLFDVPADNEVGYTLIGLAWASQGGRLHCYVPGLGNVLYWPEHVVGTSITAWKSPASEPRNSFSRVARSAMAAATQLPPVPPAAG